MHSIIYEVFLSNTNKSANRSIWPIDGTLTGTTTLGQSGSGSNGNERVLSRSPISSHTQDTLFLEGKGLTPTAGGYSQHILCPTDIIAK